MRGGRGCDLSAARESVLRSILAMPSILLAHGDDVDVMWFGKFKAAVVLRKIIAVKYEVQFESGEIISIADYALQKVQPLEIADEEKVAVVVEEDAEVAAAAAEREEEAMEEEEGNDHGEPQEAAQTEMPAATKKSGSGVVVSGLRVVGIWRGSGV